MGSPECCDGRFDHPLAASIPATTRAMPDPENVNITIEFVTKAPAIHRRRGIHL